MSLRFEVGQLPQCPSVSSYCDVPCSLIEDQTTVRRVYFISLRNHHVLLRGRDLRADRLADAVRLLDGNDALAKRENRRPCQLETTHTERDQDNRHAINDSREQARGRDPGNP